MLRQHLLYSATLIPPNLSDPTRSAERQVPPSSSGKSSASLSSMKSRNARRAGARDTIHEGQTWHRFIFRYDFQARRRARTVVFPPSASLSLSFCSVSAMTQSFTVLQNKSHFFLVFVALQLRASVGTTLSVCLLLDGSY